MKSIFGLSTVACALSASLITSEAKAQNCNNTSSCITSTNSGAGAAVEGFGNNVGWVVEGYNSGAGIGVFGYSSGSNGTQSIGVEGQSNNGPAIWGLGANSNGVVGQNSRTDWNAAAISALPGNSNGLGIYCGGGAQKPGGGSWTGLSDVRVKKDIKEFRAGLAELKRLHPVRYKYNGLGGSQDDGHEFVGMIAQELEQVLPEMVQSSKAKLRPGDAEETDIKRIDPSAFTYVLINAVQEQQKTIEEQNARIARLERGRSSLVSSLAPGGVGIAALGLVPLGLVVGRRRRKPQET
jgi:Chaperone of endosialidase